MIENSKELEAWLFEHTNIQGHKCDGIKGTIKTVDQSEEFVNVKYIDTVTKEEFNVIYMTY